MTCKEFYIEECKKSNPNPKRRLKCFLMVVRIIYLRILIGLLIGLQNNGKQMYYVYFSGM